MRQRALAVSNLIVGSRCEEPGQRVGKNPFVRVSLERVRQPIVRVTVPPQLHQRQRLTDARVDVRGIRRQHLFVVGERFARSLHRPKTGRQPEMRFRIVGFMAERGGKVLDSFSVLTLLHEEAIYLHEGTQYHVDKLDWDEQKASAPKG